ncbi:MAG: hypothetical protein CL542_02015 [Alcanivorax sp.]|jgi:antitoxin component of RelBE/YafQ-DinJ toxin-antitoxin module|nr:hypothetical protein [Alcanivorax sp.]MBT75914.1 hypothetical protein [Alcanivorax sp.]HCK25588.1 hypothetical protein [Alcanivorax sp.]|tara:strand:+ start:1718 stop:1912 length:195 start_codon:yes stop_codon:yes gene_type:complete
MAKGKSGRLVIEIDPELKQELYRVLEKEGLSLKAFFLGNVKRLLTEKGQPGLFKLQVQDDRSAD